MAESTYSDFEKLFRQHSKDLCNLAYNIVRDKDAAKDIVQDVFFKLWKNKDQVERGEQIRHYLFKATSHTCLNYLRSSKKIVKIDAESTLQNIHASASHEEVGYKELELRVAHAINNLPAKCKTIYLLSRHEGMKYQEIADTLEISIKTVENQMGIALEKLRNELKPFLSIEFLGILFLLGYLLYNLWL
jgi:RNA polymerase sigma-70 factor, ECF subfamily